MKIPLLTFLGALALALPLLAQTPAASPEATLAASPIPTISPASQTPTVASDSDEDLDTVIERKLKNHFKISIDGDHKRGDGDIPEAVIPIVAISVFALFGAPVLIVGLIMYFSFSKSRALHRTVRMMVEKGQPVPEALLNPPPVVRQRSDIRRGVVLVMVGLGLMIFFAALNDWEGGAWSLGIIPFLIGLGYLLVWKLEVRKDDRPAGDTQQGNASPKV